MLMVYAVCYAIPVPVLKMHDCLFIKTLFRLLNFKPMEQHLGLVALLVNDYDEAISFYTQKLGFILIEDTAMTDTKRWVVVSPRGHNGCHILLAKAANDRQLQNVGNQTGGRVGFFLYTDDFWRDHSYMTANGVKFIREPVSENYGTVAVFEDLYGNLWDLIEHKGSAI
jgi:catechol 2,3-dioxygenase-like lactoylglutathione lyase family enzyme